MRLQLRVGSLRPFPQSFRYTTQRGVKPWMRAFISCPPIAADCLRIEFRREGSNLLFSNSSSTRAERLPDHKIFEVPLSHRFRLVLGHLALWEGDKLCFGWNGLKSA